MISHHTTIGKQPWHDGIASGLHLLSAMLFAIVLAGCAHASTTTAAFAPPDARSSIIAANNSIPGMAAASDLAFSDARGLTLNKANRIGRASYYGRRFAGNLTASGERFDPNELTAAHRTLPFGTRVLVTNLDNGRHVTVRINDRGPFIASRIIDLSRRAARHIGMLHSGTAEVRLQVLGQS